MAGEKEFEESCVVVADVVVVVYGDGDDDDDEDFQKSKVFP